MVNIIHHHNDVIEYIFLSSFFKMFGVPVYNSIDGVRTSSDAFPDRPESDRIANIVVSDDISTAYADFNLSKETHYVFVSRYGSVGNGLTGVIAFPSEMYNTNDCRNFFQNIYLQCKEQGVLNEEDAVFAVLNEMVSMYIDCDIIHNYYLPTRVLMNSENAPIYIFALKEKCDKYRKRINMEGKDAITFASIYLHYIVNRICTTFDLFPVYEWDWLIGFIPVLSRLTTIQQQQSSLLAALILDESKRNINVMVKLYNKHINKYTYYAMYRLARVYEFQLKDRAKASDWLEESINANETYYRSIYKLGVYDEEQYNYEKALKYYRNTIGVLSKFIDEDCWQPNEMSYYIKTCARIMEIGRRIKSQAIYDEYASKIRQSAQMKKFRNNKFLSVLCQFLRIEELKEDIYKDLVSNVNQHLMKFCEADFCKQNEMTYTNDK